MSVDYAGSLGNSKRVDGHLVKLPAAEAIQPNLVHRRCDAECSYTDCFDVTDTGKWILAQRRLGCESMSLQDIVTAAYVRAVAAVPVLRRFVAGRKVFSHNSIEVVSSFRSYKGYEYSDTLIKTEFESTDTVFDVNRKTGADMAEADHAGGDSPLQAYTLNYAKRGRFVRGLVRLLFIVMDFFGLLPNRRIAASPFHGSMRIYNTSALNIGPVTRHLSNIGTVPLVISLGAARTVNGRNYVDVVYTYDSRVLEDADMAKVFECIKTCVEAPSQLEYPPDKVYDDE